MPLTYYQYMIYRSKEPWNLGESNYADVAVGFIIPTYNEENTILYKLMNFKKLKYPKNLINLIIVDSNSNDGTIKYVKEFQDENPDINITIIIEKERKGKAHALNMALENVNSKYVIISDSDCFIPEDSIKKSLKYFTIKDIAAVAGNEKLVNVNDNWITKNEQLYKDNILKIRTGESKVHSTICFEGGYAIYRKEFLEEFDEVTGVDDSGTALNIVQRGKRTIIAPDVFFYTTFPTTLSEKYLIKTRRARHLITLWKKSVKLYLRNELKLPSIILIPETYLHLINPYVFTLLMLNTLYISLERPVLFVLYLTVLLIPSTRYLTLELIMNNLILLYSNFLHFSGKNITIWKKSEESRKLLDLNYLYKENLI